MLTAVDHDADEQRRLDARVRQHRDVQVAEEAPAALGDELDRLAGARPHGARFMEGRAHMVLVLARVDHAVEEALREATRTEVEQRTRRAVVFEQLALHVDQQRGHRQVREQCAEAVQSAVGAGLAVGQLVGLGAQFGLVDAQVLHQRLHGGIAARDGVLGGMHLAAAQRGQGLRAQRLLGGLGLVDHRVACFDSPLELGVFHSAASSLSA